MAGLSDGINNVAMRLVSIGLSLNLTVLRAISVLPFGWLSAVAAAPSRCSLRGGRAGVALLVPWCISDLAHGLGGGLMTADVDIAGYESGSIADGCSALLSLLLFYRVMM